MKITFETEDGKTLDTSNIEYMTLNGVNYAMLKVVETKEVQKVEDFSLENFFGVQKQPKQPAFTANNVRSAVRQWFDTNPRPGDSQVFKGTTHAIRISTELFGRKCSFKKIRRNMYQVTYLKPQEYARTKKKTT